MNEGEKQGRAGDWRLETGDWKVERFKCQVRETRHLQAHGTRHSRGANAAGAPWCARVVRWGEVCPTVQWQRK